MARTQTFSPFESFVAGRSARQAHDYGQTRNRLAEMELADAPAQMARRNKLADLQMQGAEVGLQAQQQQLGAEQAKFAYAKLKQAQESGNPKAFITQQIPDLAAQLQSRGIDINTMDDASVAQLTDQLARKYAGEAGIAPTAPQENLVLQQTEGPYGSQVLTYGNTMRVVEQPQAPKPAAPKDERLVQVGDANGNPTWVRESDAVNKPAYVARDKPAAADLKYQREIKSKQPRLKAARRRVDRLSEAILGAKEVRDTQGNVIKPAVKGIAQNRVFDGGPLDQYVLAWTNQGQEVAQSKAALLSELTALTRVPGIGSQSDLETRLASLPFPSAEFAPEVNAKAVAEIQAFVADLEDAYGVVQGEFESSEINSLLDKYAPQ